SARSLRRFRPPLAGGTDRRPLHVASVRASHVRSAHAAPTSIEARDLLCGNGSRCHFQNVPSARGMTCPTAGNAALRMSANPVVDVADNGPQAWVHALVVSVLFGLLNSFIRFGVGMLLLAYVVRRIGPQQWGLVVIATSAVAFMALVQLGASAGLGKQLNEHLSRGDFDRFTQVFTAGRGGCARAPWGAGRGG